MRRELGKSLDVYTARTQFHFEYQRYRETTTSDSVVSTRTKETVSDDIHNGKEDYHYGEDGRAITPMEPHKPKL